MTTPTPTEIEIATLPEGVELPEGAVNFHGMFKAFEDADVKEWRYDRNASLGASEVFQCIRMSFFTKWGYEQDDDHEDDWGAAKRGDLIENHFAVPAVKAILTQGETLALAGDEQDTLRVERLSATPDGLVINAARNALYQLGIKDIESDCFVTEFKSHDPRANIKEEKAVHRGQVQVQMGLLHELTEYKPMYAIIFYFDASWLSKIKFYVVRFDPGVYAVAKKRSEMVFTEQEPDQLVAEGRIDDGCTYCKFTEECAIASKIEVPKTKRKIEKSEDLDELADLARRRDFYQVMQKDGEAQVKEINQEIKELLRKHDTKGASDDRFSISLTWNNGKKSTDLLAMQADGINIEDYQNEGNGFQTLRVTWKGDSNA